MKRDAAADQAVIGPSFSVGPPPPGGPPSTKRVLEVVRHYRRASAAQIVQAIEPRTIEAQRKVLFILGELIDAGVLERRWDTLGNVSYVVPVAGQRGSLL